MFGWGRSTGTASAPSDEARDAAPYEPAAIELLEAGVIDGYEFHAIRTRIDGSARGGQKLPPPAGADAHHRRGSKTRKLRRSRRR